MLHFFSKRSSIDSNPSSDDGTSSVDDASSTSKLQQKQQYMFKSVAVRRLSQHRLLLAAEPHHKSRLPPSHVVDDDDTGLPTLTSSSSLRSTFLLDDEFQPTSVDWNPHYPWFRVLTEIVDTETSFVETLHTLHQVFNHVFHDTHRYTHGSLLALRSATAALLTLHTDLCTDLRRPADMLHLRQDTLHLANVFQSHLPYFKLYAHYCLAYTDVSSLLLRLHQRKQHNTTLKRQQHTTQVDEFLAAITAAAHVLQVDLQSEMIKPVQRLCRYPLLMSELHHHAMSHAGCLTDTLATLVRDTKVVAAYVNDRVQADTNNAKFLRLRRKLTLGFGCPEVMVPARQYVTEAAVHVASLVTVVPWNMWTAKPQTLVLLSDVLLITKRRRQTRLQVGMLVVMMIVLQKVTKLLPLVMVSVEEVDVIEFPKWSRAKCFVLRYKTESGYASGGTIMMMQGHVKTYVVVCDCEKKKIELLSLFRETLAQVVDAMVMPPPPPAQQPFTLRHTRLPSSVSAV
ncbi:hypothetical protein DYB38_009980 [Aphanomyces astaci]|uniref:DH domain-containing protein n=1 Tax=Aphanomyces astaci TaxID=112090 RepID=A0A397DNS3_APHAT|nr:hypothetical protein DYB38_009980 [Aphanomyces astaci]